METFASGDRGQLKEAHTQKKIDWELMYVTSVQMQTWLLEHNFSQNNTQVAWRAMKIITGYKDC